MKKLLFGLICLSTQIFASGPIGHAYFAKKFLEKHPVYQEEQLQSFMLGTLFPDIRDIDPPLYEKTHLTNVTLEDILQEPSPFVAGIKLHCFVDDVRSDFMQKYGVLDLVSDLPINRKSSFVKLLEEELFYSIYDWASIIDYLNTIDPTEVEWENNTEIIQQWHALLLAQFSDTPSNWLEAMSAKEEGYFKYSQEELKIWHEYFEEAAARESLQTYIKDLTDHFNEAISQ